jgi:hypothetical protein
MSVAACRARGHDARMAVAGVADRDAAEEVEVLVPVGVPQRAPSPRTNSTGKRA